MEARRGLAAALLALATAGCTTRTDGPSPQGSAPPPADAVVVRISYGSEKKSFLTESIESFHRRQPRTRAGHPIRIEAVAEGSAESIESILAGRTDIAVWSPASSLLVDVLNDRWAEVKGGLASGRRNRRLLETWRRIVESRG